MILQAAPKHTVDFSPDQEVALRAILDWRNDPRGKPYLALGGYAGTGKTTIVSYLVDVWPSVATAALCGKAAHVLRSKGADAQTVHSLIYVPYENARGEIRFRKRDHLDGVRTIMVDEASMIDHLLLQDLLSFELPILFVGDHGQLEPIGTNPGLMKAPDIRLERIHRQAADNPILRLATAFREGRRAPDWTDPKGRLTVTRRNDFWSLIRPELQMICGYNATRHKVNARVREMLGRTGAVEAGDRLICLRNNRRWNIFNGQQVTVLGVEHECRATVDLEIETDDSRSFILRCLKAQFGADLIDDWRSQEVALMDYGFCLTAHKAQGSEWADVLVLEEIAGNWDARRWRYTVSTRARQSLTYCR